MSDMTNEPIFHFNAGQNRHSGVAPAGQLYGVGLNPSMPSYPPQQTIGEPFLTAQLGPRHAAVWVITDNTVILQVGCQTRTLQNWKERTDEILAAQYAGPEKANLLAFIGFVEAVLANRLAEIQTTEDGEARER